MSRVAKSPLKIPSEVTVELTSSELSAKGKNGELNMPIHELVSITQKDDQLIFAPKSESNLKQNRMSWMQAGTARSNAANLIVGVSKGWKKSLTLVGVGYRAQLKNKVLDLNLGFSHPVTYKLPEAVSVELPSNTEIVIEGANKQQVGQIAAEIRAFRPPEPYKGKGVRYTDEQVYRKETKKK